MILAGFLFLFAPVPAAHGHPAVLPADTLVFSLTVSEHREEYKDASRMDEPPDATISADYVLFGRIRPRGCGGRTAVVFADSIVYKSRSPLVLSTFMSADTMYYRARGGTAPVNRSEMSDYDSMLTCLFNGPAMLVEYTSADDISSVTHFKGHCQGGQYGHINLPVTMSFFMPDSSALHGEKNNRWKRTAAVPSFSGLGFHPRLRLSCRIVDAQNGSRTLSVNGDSTIVDHQTTTPNGEEVAIMSGRFRLGGTFTTDRAIGLCRSGEIRIRETMELSRPRVSHTVTAKSCDYTIRFRIH
jgi:hypothetical protein